MRQEVVSNLTRQLGVITSKRVGLALGVWGAPGIGKTHTVHIALRGLPCPSLSLHATSSGAQIVAALPRPRALPAWAESQLERLGRGEALDKNSFAATLAAVLGALAPFVLHFEDIHEASRDRLAAIEALASNLTRTRGAGLVVTSRSQPPSVFRSQHLEPITGAEAAALLYGELHADPPRAGLEWIQERTGGNPLFVLEFARYLKRQGFLWSDGQRWHWRPPDEAFVPTSISALVGSITGGPEMTPLMRAVLEARAVLTGEPTHSTPTASLWADTAGVSASELAEARSALERLGLLRGNEFAHPLFGEVIADELGVEAKRTLARRAIAAGQDSDPEWVAQLITRAELPAASALELLRHAIARAERGGDELRAAQLMARAAPYASGAERVALALAAERGLLRTGDVRLREQLARLALETDPENREARFALTTIHSLTGRFDTVAALVAELPEAEQGEPRWLEGVFRALCSTGRFREAISFWEEHPALHTFNEGRNVSNTILAYCNIGDAARAEALIDATLRRRDLSELDPLRIGVLNQLALLRSDQGRLEEADALHEQSIELVNRSGNQHSLATGLFNRALNQVRLGRFALAGADAEAAITLFERAGNASAAAYASIFHGDLLLHQGEFEQSERVLLRCYESYWRWNSGPRRIACEIELALLYAQWRSPYAVAGATRFARDALGHARTAETSDMAPLALATAARVAAWRGEAGSALELAQEAVRLLAAELQDDEDGYACLVALAVALEQNGQREAALERWQAALRIAQSLRLSLESHEARLELARLQGDWEGLRSLRAWFLERGLGLGVQRADAALDLVAPSSPLPSRLPGQPNESSPDTARLNVLGPVNFERDGAPIPTRARKRLEFLTYLLEARIAGRSEVRTLDLLDALYSDMPEPEGRKALKQLVYLNRSALGAESVVSTPNGYTLGAVSSDAEAFLASNNTELWRGAYLGDLGDGWLPGVRDALTLALRAQIEARLDSDPSEAARLGLILLEMEPFDAAVLRLAVGALERTGKLKAARAAYREGRARLLELGETLPESLEAFIGAGVIA